MDRIDNNLKELANIIVGDRKQLNTMYGAKTVEGIKDMIFQYMRDIIIRTKPEELKKYFQKKD